MKEASYAGFARHVQALTQAHSPISGFEAAVDAIVSGDPVLLEKLLLQVDVIACRRARTVDTSDTLLFFGRKLRDHAQRPIKGMFHD